MLGLREQVGGHEGGVGVGRGDDEELGWAGYRVEADAAVQQALGGADEAVPRSDDLLASGDAAGAEGECGNGLRAAGRQQPLGSGDPRGGPDCAGRAR